MSCSSHLIFFFISTKTKCCNHLLRCYTCLLCSWLNSAPLFFLFFSNYILVPYALFLFWLS